MGDKSQTGFDGDSAANEVGSRTDLAALPDAVRAVLEEFRAQAAASSTKPPPSGDDSQDLPYTCRLYESIPGEEELLQLQWMRVDMSGMDSERCWAEPSGCKEEYDCGPESGLMLPAIYRVDPAQLFPLTFVGLPPELSRIDRDYDGPKNQPVTEEVPEHHLCKLGRDISKETSKRGEGLSPDIVTEVASLAPNDWSTCLEQHVDFSRSDPAAVAQLLATRSPPTFDCLLGTVLPALISHDSTVSQGKKPRIGEYGEGQEGHEEDAIRAVCRVAASVALSQGQSHLTFRNRVCKSGLRGMGLLGREAEVALAEEFSSAGNAIQPK